MKIYSHTIINQNSQNNINFTSFSLQKKYGTAIYDDNGHIDRYELSAPHGILEDLNHWKYDFPHWSRDKVIDFVKGSKVFLDEKIFAFIGGGFYTSVFDIGNNRVLKISEQNPFEYREHNPKFDIPLLSPIYKHGNMYGYIQAKANKQVTFFDVLSVKLKIKKEGYKAVDFKYHPRAQVGLYEGTSYLLDSRCAVKQNNLKTRFAQWLFEHFYRGKKGYNARANNPTIPIYQFDIPLPNYSKKEVYTIIKNIIKSW